MEISKEGLARADDMIQKYGSVINSSKLLQSEAQANSFNAKFPLLVLPIKNVRKILCQKILSAYSLC